MMNSAFYFIDNVVWWVRHRFDPDKRFHIVKTGLRPGYHDIDERMLHGCMTLLCEFVEVQKGGVSNLLDHADECVKEGFDEQAKIYYTAIYVYEWWKAQTPETLDPMDVIKSEKASERQTEMLKLVIDIRESLWV